MVWVETIEREKKERMRETEYETFEKTMEATHRWLFQAGRYTIASKTGGSITLLLAKIISFAYLVIVPVAHIYYNLRINNFGCDARGKIQIRNENADQKSSFKRGPPNPQLGIFLLIFIK
jgi:hypothetical protein